ncbi:cation diffusion facilitator family transporter [Chondrinema litorale]|uniref:cation diffusion facilitator family transporter n=1 Tax=Chondrinema litorale TaxID=2994555 RepID=UPI002542E238|nr:cation diffusion facilitator family transporter [Chondrinema litorale]UZR96573.1 cation diffusion facilitator family transporter [Chondrinema litorale]
MGHHHSHQHNHSHEKGLSTAFWLNAIFSVIEVVGGIFTNSTAIIADAFHDFVDALAIGLAVVLEKISKKKGNEKFSYGYKRFSLLSAIGMSVFLLGGAVIMLVNAFQALMNPEVVNSKGMLLLAVLGIAINGIAFIKIKNSGGEDHAHHHHAHGHNHEHNHNSKAIMLHLLEDVLGWAAVLIGGVIIYFTHWYWIDPVLAIGIAGFIGYNATKNLISSGRVLLQSVPESIDMKKLSNDLLQINGVRSIHNLHVWTLDGNDHVCTLHLVTEDDQLVLHQYVQTEVEGVMANYHIQHPTIQMESCESKCQYMNK